MKKILSLFAAVLFAGSLLAETATMKYTGSTTQNMKPAVNNAVLVNLDDNLFVVTSKKNKASNEIGLNKDGSMRLYADKNDGNGTLLTFFYDFGTINSIRLNIQQETEYEVTSDGTPVTGKDRVFTIESQAFTIQNIHKGENADQLQLTSVEITYTPDPELTPKVYAPVIAPEVEEFYEQATIKITCATEGAKIYYRLDGTYPDRSQEGTLLYSAPFKIEESTQIEAVAVLGEDESKPAYKAYVKVDAIDVANAIGMLKGASPIKGKYVEGIICKIDEFKEASGTITYWISDDGKTGDNEHMLEVYQGLGLNGDQFVTENALQVGDQVVVYGDLKVYKQKDKDDIFEFDKNNYLVKLIEKSPTEAIDNTAAEVKAVKTFENGQLVIIKNGVKYTATGTVVK